MFKQDALVLVDWLFFFSNQDIAFIKKSERVPVLRNFLLKDLVGFNVKVKVKGGSSRENASFFTKTFSRDYLYLGPVLLLKWYFFCLYFLIAGRDKFVLCFQVDPEFKSIRTFFIGSWHLSVYYSSSGCHPLNIPWLE